MAITPLPSAPLPTDTTQEFNTKAFAWVAALDGFTTQANQLATDVNADEASAAQSAIDADLAAQAATGAANFKGDYNGATTYQVGESVLYNGKIYISKVVTTGVLPTNTTNWLLLENGDVTTDGTQTLTNKTIVDPIITLSGSQGTTGQALLSQGAGQPPVYGSVASFEVGMMLTYPRRDPLSQWSITTTVAGSNNGINGLTYGGGIYVAVRSGGQIATSTDAVTWTSRTSGTTSVLNSVTYGLSQYVAAGAGGAILTSSDGITWTARSSGSASILYSVSFGNNLYVYGGVGGALGTSTDGVSWTARTSGATSSIYATAYGNGLYLYGGHNGQLRTSTNGVTWTSRTSGTTSSIRAIAYANGAYLYATESGAIATSTDAITWSFVDSKTTSSLYSLIYGDGFFVYGGSGGALGTSTNGTTWVSKNSSTTSQITSLAYNSDGDEYIYSASQSVGKALPDQVPLDATWLPCDGRILQQSSYPDLFNVVGLRKSGGSLPFVQTTSTQPIFAVGYGNGMYVYAANQGLAGYSTNGIQWGTTTLQTTSQPYKIAYGNNLFVTCMFNGVSYSNDGKSWQSTGVAAQTFFGITFGNGLFVMCGSNGVIYTSTNGSSWTSRTSPTTSTLRAAAYGNGSYIVVGETTAAAYSPDGTNWNGASTGTTTKMLCATYGNGIFLIGGESGDVRRSTNNGASYSSVNFSSATGYTSSINAATYLNGAFWVTGNDGFLATSTNGAIGTWKVVNSGVSRQINGISGTDDLVVYGGEGNFIASFSPTTPYNPETEFALPKQGVFPAGEENDQLYIKATT